ncbi:amino acid ABC transporter ATP-binding/permease protein [Schleiferilactobacillus shenzhenensis]|uniref:ABC transporter ATP-binding protein n=1 Tax=Schleiferilactobacillus shenzhenensis LY-73 TaxID=1231336 RepID=U4TR88_9LACO|nr:ABC transporter ATP-binding protein [Schleiferilactobacillus shenzhenensis]ERL65970.1 hypothetical protein L248_2046 [Schleiferilactobacillus shenzhenensis LY-73]
MIHRMLFFIRRLIPVLFLSWLAGMVAELGQVFVAWQSGRILVSLGQNVGPLTAWLAVGVVLAALCAYVEQYAGHYVAFKVLADIRNHVYRKVEQLAPAGLDKQQSGDLLKAVGSDIEAMEVFYAHTIVPLAIGIGTLIVLPLFYAQASLTAAFTMLTAGLLVGFGLPFFRYRQLATANAQLAAVQGTTQQQMLEAVRGRDALLQLVASDRTIQRVDAQYQVEGPAQQRVGWLNWQKNWLAWLIIIAGWFLLAAASGAATGYAPMLLPYMLAFPFSFRPLLALANLPDALSNGFGATRRIWQLLDTPVPATNTGGTPLVQPITALTVAHLNYAYPDRAQGVLADVSLHLAKGQIGGIIGESGAGKSTLAKLIMKWYPAPAGTIQVNGTPISDVSAASLWQEINYLPQQAHIFQASVRQNLTLGAPEIAEAAITRVLDQVRLTERIARLPQGLDTVIGAAEPVLSAGEQQRLALARAFLHPSSVLILDEPTSNLDVVNERIILNSVKQYYPGIVLMITHRLETLGICDVVWRLENGQMTEMPTRKQAIQTAG